MSNMLGDYLKKYRKKHNLSLRQFSELSNISHTHIDSIERGTDPRTNKEVNGEAMSPRIRTGDLVVVKKTETISQNEIVVVQVENENILRRIRFTKKGITLTSDNEKYNPQSYSHEEIETLPIVILGKVVELRAKL